MSWKLNFIHNPQIGRPDDGWPIGTCWFGKWYFDPARTTEADRLTYLELAKAGKKFLSVHYLEEWARIRPPIIVTLPGGLQFCVDSQQVRDGVYAGGGWTVTGDLPNITVNPSIVISTYHGWIKNGEISDDLDGRTYNGQ